MKTLGYVLLSMGLVILGLVLWLIVVLMRGDR